MTTTNTWAARIEQDTLANATNAGDRWTLDDVQFVVAFTDDVKDEELALALGRSLYAVWAIQNRIRTEGVEGVIASFDTTRNARSYVARVASSPTYTFIDGDVPPGW